MGLISPRTCLGHRFALALFILLVSPAAHAGDNGITVGQPKLFDDRALTVMLQGLDASLKGLNAFDKTTLTQALGRFQGLTADTSSLGISITGPTLSGRTTDVTTDTSSDVTQPVTMKSETKMDRTEVKPSPASAPDQTANLSLSGISFGPSAQNLLAEQTSLSYQIINLRLLLQRSLTDRVFIDDKGLSGKRRQVILGFQISVDPAKEHRGKVAEVEIQIMPTSPKSQKISLVSLLPESKTYNVATITNHVTSLGVGAIVQPVNLGVSASNQHESQYVVRDVDTVALERLTDATKSDNSVRFAWQFRPVLGRAAVDPGIRQVYAVLSLPALATVEDFPCQAQVTTRWRDYDNRSGTVYGEVAGSRQIRKVNSLQIPNSSDVEEALTPKVSTIAWTPADDGRVLVQAQGENFDPDTGVLVGTAPVGPKDGFTILHDNRLEFLVSAAALMNTPPVVVGIEGPPRPLLQPLARDTAVLAGISIDSVTPTVNTLTTGGTKQKVVITLKTKRFGIPESWSEGFLVDYGGEVFGLGDRPITLEPAMDQKSATLSFQAPLQLIQECRSVRVVAPFWGPLYSDTYDRTASDDFEADKVVLLASNSISTRYGILGSNFRGDTLLVTAGKRSYTTHDAQLSLVSPVLLTLDLSPDETRGLKQLLVKQGGRNLALLLPISEPPPVLKPTVTTIPDTDAGNATDVKLEGTNLESVEKVQFLGQSLDFEAAGGGKSLTLKASEALANLAATPGKKQIYLVVSDGSQVPVVLTVKKP